MHRDDKRSRSYAQATKPEKIVAELLRKHNIEFVKEYKIMGKFYDFYIPSRGCAIEVQGVYWHSKNIVSEDLKLFQLQNRINDIYKKAIAAVKGMHLIVIWEDNINESKLLDAIQSLSADDKNPKYIDIDSFMKNKVEDERESDMQSGEL